MSARASIAAAGRAGSCWRALESAELERGGGIDCCRTSWRASSGVGGREQQWSRGQATGAMPHPAQCAAALPRRRAAELPQPPVLCCPAALPVPLTLVPVWLPVSVVFWPPERMPMGVSGRPMYPAPKTHNLVVGKLLPPGAVGGTYHATAVVRRCAGYPLKCRSRQDAQARTCPS